MGIIIKHTNQSQIYQQLTSEEVMKKQQAFLTSFKQIRDLSDFYTRKSIQNSLEGTLNKNSKMSSTEDLDDLSYNSISSHSTDGYIYETLKNDCDIVNSHLEESTKYKPLVENLEYSKQNYNHFKNSLSNSENFELLSQIEEKLNRIAECKIDLLKAKYQDEINLKISSIKFVMEKMNRATIKWSNEENEKKIAKMKQEVELNKKIMSDYEIRIKDLTNEVSSYRKMIEANNGDLEMRPLQEDTQFESHHTFDINNQFDYLRDEINEKDKQIELFRAKEDVYLNEISRLKIQLNDYLEYNSSKANTTNFEMESALIDTTTDSAYREPRIVVTQMRDDRVNGLIIELDAKNRSIQNLTNELSKLKEEVETMTHPLFYELQSEMQNQFNQEYEELKICYENKLREELEIYKTTMRSH
ncbi:hypothetical protein BpHYR1_020605 [Brachionus plicatilis]|uniref:Uncharacterized protein n=1 Tax=Brachionus plicatilis TaxID=10195 RepID=A0A3M7PQC2_BRAPC|nr:hypothetical protein BpHYR1_020605 [Brachionus plicatilis]